MGSDSEAKQIESYLRKQSAALEASAAEWEPTRAQMVKWDAEARRQLEARRHIGCVQTEPPAQQGGGDGEDSDSESNMYQVACPSCPRCTSQSVSWDLDPSAGGVCHDCSYKKPRS